MLEKTIEDVVKYVSLKSYLVQNPNDNIVKEAVKLLQNKIEKDLNDDKARLDKIKSEKERIEAKKK